MLLAFATMLAVATMSQIYLVDIYRSMPIANDASISDHERSTEAQGLQAFAVSSVVTHIGIWAVKMNFLLFFRRLGMQITAYRIAWWFVLVVTIACGIASLALVEFQCLYGPVGTLTPICFAPKYYKADV